MLRSSVMGSLLRAMHHVYLLPLAFFLIIVLSTW